MGRLGHPSRKFKAAGALFGLVAGEWVRPEEERTQSTDGDPDVIGHFPDGFVIAGSGLG